MARRFDFPPEREERSAKGIITGDTVDKVLNFFETKMGRFSGARLVARAWLDPAFGERLVPIRRRL